MQSGMFDLVGIPGLIDNFLLQTSAPSDVVNFVIVFVFFQIH